MFVFLVFYALLLSLIKNINEKKGFMDIILLKESGVAVIREYSKVKKIAIDENNYQIGDIHVGKIKTTLSNIKASFIQIDSVGKSGFIQIENYKSNQIKKKCLTHQKRQEDSKILVQITKEPTGNKGPSVSKNIELKGKYVSLFPGSGRSTHRKKVLRKPSEHYFKLLKILFSFNNLSLEIEEKFFKIHIKHIAGDLKKIYKQWILIQKKVHESNTSKLVSEKMDFSYKILLKFYNSNVRRIVLDSENQAIKINNMLMQWKRKKKSLNIEYSLHKKDICKKYNLEKVFQQVIQSKIKLKSGAFIIIEKTEALTVIDVNSGTFKNKTKLERSTFWINCEAAKEISNQLVLRNIAGVVVVDFIDLDSQKDQFHLLRYFDKFLHKDKKDPKIVQFSEIGLVELTRTRKGKNVYDVFTIDCYKCNGNGYLLKNLNFINEKKYDLTTLNTLSIQ
jgi:ribonuclease E